MFELFHAIGNAESAQVRQFIVEKDLTSQVQFRNVAYDEVKKDLTARGGTTPPALWDGTVLSIGAAAVVERLNTLLK